VAGVDNIAAACRLVLGPRRLFSGRRLLFLLSYGGLNEAENFLPFSPVIGESSCGLHFPTGYVFKALLSVKTQVAQSLVANILEQPE
jgi:hypothetical protein